MQQSLNLVFTANFLRIFRASENSLDLLHQQRIVSNESFFKENLKEGIRKHHQNPEKINLWYNPTKYTLLPSTIFLPSKLENYFELNFGEKNSDETIYYESIIPLNLVVIYAIPTWMHTLKTEINIFGDTKLLLGKHLLSLEKNKSSELVESVIYDDYMDVFVKSNGKLVLANHYEIQNENDFVYFLLLIKNKLNLTDNFSLNIKKTSSKIENEGIKSLLKSIQEFNSIEINFSDDQTYYNSILCE